MEGHKQSIGFVVSVGLSGLLWGGALRLIAEFVRLAGIDLSTLGPRLIVLVLFSPVWFLITRFGYRLVVVNYRAIEGRPSVGRIPRPTGFALAVLVASAPTGIVIALLLPGVVAALVAIIGATVLRLAVAAAAAAQGGGRPSA